MKPIALVISCEHAVNSVPATYQHLFTGREAVLNSHHALDIGTLNIAKHLHQMFSCDYIQAPVTRLLIDCNRSLTHPQCFSEFTKHLSSVEKQQLIDSFYQPYRQTAERLIKEKIDGGHQVLHLSIHSFIPECDGILRNAGIGLLYDHTRHAEQEVARIWKSLLFQQTPTYRIRMNYPYHGHSDAFTSTLRKQYNEHHYLGFEVESNQALLLNKESCDEVAHALSSSLQELLQLL